MPRPEVRKATFLAYKALNVAFLNLGGHHQARSARVPRAQQSEGTHRRVRGLHGQCIGQFAEGRRYRGAVMFIASEAEFTPKTVQTAEERVRLVYAVKIEITGDESYDLKPGMPADVRVEITE